MQKRKHRVIVEVTTEAGSTAKAARQRVQNTLDGDVEFRVGLKAYRTKEFDRVVGPNADPWWKRLFA